MNKQDRTAALQYFLTHGPSGTTHAPPRHPRITEDDPRWGQLQYKRATRAGLKPQARGPGGIPYFTRPGAIHRKGPYSRGIDSTRA